MPKAEVRVDAAPINARNVLFGHYLSARRDRISQGDLKLARVPARALGNVRLSVSDEPAAVAGALGSGSDNLRAMTKTATLHCSRFDPVGPDM